MRKIVHIDMDCFYAAVEALDNPELRGKPFVVGGRPESRGVVATASYEARKYGIGSAMSSAVARRRYPDLIFVRPRMQRYKEESYKIREIFGRYTDKIEPLSLDEAYLDVTDSAHCQGSATWIAKAIRADIFRTTGLTASAGVAPNKFLAKVASDWNKPNGLKVITPAEVSNFVANLPVGKIPGVGKVTNKKLQDEGIHVCRDVRERSREWLQDRFGKWGGRLYEYAHGRDPRAVVTHRIAKSISVEDTFSSDIRDLTDCKIKITELTERLLERMQRRAEKPIAGIFLKLKFSDFSTTTVQSARMQNASKESFFELLETGLTRSDLAIRLIGVGVRLRTEKSGPEHTPRQLELPFP